MLVLLNDVEVIVVLIQNSPAPTPNFPHKCLIFR
jgi:hypothetical protein